MSVETAPHRFEDSGIHILDAAHALHFVRIGLLSIADKLGIRSRKGREKISVGCPGIQHETEVLPVELKLRDRSVSVETKI